MRIDVLMLICIFVSRSGLKVCVFFFPQLDSGGFQLSDFTE